MTQLYETTWNYAQKDLSGAPEASHHDAHRSMRRQRRSWKVRSTLRWIHMSTMSVIVVVVVTVVLRKHLHDASIIITTTTNIVDPFLLLANAFVINPVPAPGRRRPHKPFPNRPLATTDDLDGLNGTLPSAIITVTTTTTTTTTKRDATAATAATATHTDPPTIPTSILPANVTRHIQGLIDERSRARWEGDYQTADAIKEQLLQQQQQQQQQLPLPSSWSHLPYKLVIQDLPRAQGGGSTWKLEFVMEQQQQEEGQEQDTTTTTASTPSVPISSSSSPSSVLQLAHRALGLAVSCSQTMTPLHEKLERLQPMVDQAQQLLEDWYSVHQQHQSISMMMMIVSGTGNDTNNNNDDNNNDDCNNNNTITTTTTVPLGWEDLVGDDSNNNDNSTDSSTSTATAWRHWRHVETTLRGRKAADAAFWWALAGVTNKRLFQLLQHVTVKELRRFGTKPTCRAKDILQMMDRFAVAGVRDAPLLQQVAQECLQSKGDDKLENNDDDASSMLLELHSDGPLLMLWKFSARQKKQQSFLKAAQKHWETTFSDTVLNNTNSNNNNNTLIGSSNAHQPFATVHTALTSDWQSTFSDPTKPLVLDVGCGMGISLLGLATTASQNNAFADCNMLGVDLSGLTIGYAQGMSHRWNLSDRLQFKVDSAESVLESIIASYPGVVSLCLIQFPTPYQLATNSEKDGSGGNSQLPTSADYGFMVSTKLLTLIREALCLHDNKEGTLLLQSNCEDVAVYMRDTAIESAGFVGVKVPDPLVEPETDDLPQRTVNWLATIEKDARSNLNSRAIGNYWSKTSLLLPPKACTETEVACRLNRVPIHRCLLQVPAELQCN